MRTMLRPTEYFGIHAQENIYSPGKSILSQLALHYMVNCNANCDWSDVSGELNSSSGNVVKLWAEMHINGSASNKFTLF